LYFLLTYNQILDPPTQFTYIHMLYIDIFYEYNYNIYFIYFKYVRNIILLIDLLFFNRILKLFEQYKNLQNAFHV